jgi:hypothetical protein
MEARFLFQPTSFFNSDWCTLFALTIFEVRSRKTVQWLKKTMKLILRLLT